MRCELIFRLLWSAFLVLEAAGTSRYLLKDSYINATALTITSFAFHSHGRYPEWVDKLFGEEAVFWNTASQGYDKVAGLTKHIPIARENYQNFAKQHAMPPLPAKIECSIELLGFARIGSVPPFLGMEDRKKHPSAGVASLYGMQGSLKDKPWPCFYRAVYANNRVEDSDKSFWTVVFFCYAPEDSELCLEYRAVSAIEPEVRFRLNLHLPTTTWDALFSTLKHEVTHEKVPGISELLHDKVAVCTVWPYVSSQPDKQQINQALIYEFIRYYSTLGIQIIAFDRDGGNWPGSFSSPYAKAHPQRGKYFNAIKTYLDYNDFTVHGLLLPLPEGQKATADMEDPSTAGVIGVYDNDKELTYSHCRFHAQAKYGVKHIIVADFDEFLYCHHVNADPLVQSSFLAGYLQKMSDKDMDQVLFGRTTVLRRNVHKSIRVCIEAELKKNADRLANGGTGEVGSLFNCFASMDFIMNKVSSKAIHLNRRCPHTSVRYACSPPSLGSKAFDCVCNSTDRMHSCDFVHMGVFGNFKVDPKLIEGREQKLMESKSELWSIVNAAG